MTNIIKFEQEISPYKGTQLCRKEMIKHININYKMIMAARISRQVITDISQVKLTYLDSINHKSQRTVGKMHGNQEKSLEIVLTKHP